MRQSHQILSNAVIIWGTRIFLLVPQLIMVPFLIHRIGDVGYGTYTLVWSFMMSIEQLQLSLQQGVVKYSAGFLAIGRTDEVNKVVGASFVYSIFLATLACIGTLMAATFYKDPSGQISSALAVVGIMILFIIPLTPYIALIQAHQRYYVGAIADTISKYVSLLAVVAWFYLVGPSVKALVVIMAGMLFLVKLAQVPIAYRLVPGLQSRPSFGNWKHFRLIVSFGGMVVLVGLCLIANSTGVCWIMSILASKRFVAHLAIMLMPSALLSSIITAVTVIVMPATSAYLATENQHMLQELLIRGMRYTTTLTLAGLLAAGLLMRSVLAIWVGPDYVFLARYAMVLLASGAFMLTTSTSHHMLKGLGRLKVTVFISLIGLVVVPIGLLLVMSLTWDNPYTAATISLAAGHIVYGCLQITFGAKAVHADLCGVFVRAYAQPLVIAAIVLVVIVGIVAYIGLEGLVAEIVVSVLAVLLFFSGCYAFITTQIERQQLKAFVQVVLDRGAAMRKSN